LFADRGRLQYLRDSNPIREVVPHVNKTTGGVLFVQNSDIAGVRPPVFSNHWHNFPFRKRIETARNAEHFYRIAREEGIERYVKPKSVSPEDIEGSEALFAFLDICGEPEFETNSHVVLYTASDCEARLAARSRKYATPVFPPGKYDDSDTRITYTGSWDPGRGFNNAFGATVSHTNDRTAEIRFQFEGSAFTYGYTRAFNRGRAHISIDNGPAAVLDQYSPRIHWQTQRRYTAQGPGVHSVSIRVTGEKDPHSGGAFVDFDFLIVEP
jgi:hypothetical protein